MDCNKREHIRAGVAIESEEKLMQHKDSDSS